MRRRDMDIKKAKQVIADDERRRWLAAIASADPAIIEVTVYPEGGSVRQMVELDPDGTWRLHP